MLVGLGIHELFQPLYIIASMTDSFAGYNSLGWPLWSFRSYSIVFQALLVFQVSVEKLAVILMTSSEHMTFAFSLAVLSTHCSEELVL